MTSSPECAHHPHQDQHTLFRENNVTKLSYVWKRRREGERGGREGGREGGSEGGKEGGMEGGRKERVDRRKVEESREETISPFFLHT